MMMEGLCVKGIVPKKYMDQHLPCLYFAKAISKFYMFSI